ncbi:MAG TPA: hypothetical protein PLQ87_06170, partial [Phycisphaerae bacterium]|nr:hypothetical protein [Phycisphaerae bacterium]
MDLDAWQTLGHVVDQRQALLVQLRLLLRRQGPGIVRLEFNFVRLELALHAAAGRVLDQLVDELASFRPTTMVIKQRNKRLQGVVNLLVRGRVIGQHLPEDALG